MQFETKIPIKKHLKKFIQHEAGTKDLILGQSNMYSAMFSSFFTQKSSHLDDSQIRAERNKWTHICVKFSFDDLRRRGFYMTMESILLFNQVVDKQFRAILLHHIELKKSLQSNFVMKETIINFLALYDITEDEMKYDAIVKWVQRTLKDKNKNHN